MNKTCFIGSATKTAVDYLKRPLLDDLKREYTKAVHELWYGVFMKECTCTDIDIVKRQDYSNLDKDCNDIFDLGINVIFDKNKCLDELTCVTVELDESDTIVETLNKYSTDLYGFEIDNNGVGTECYVNVYSRSSTSELFITKLFIIINTNDLNGTVIKMLANTTEHNVESFIRVSRNILLNESLFETFIESLLVKHVISKYENIDLGNIVTTNFVETKSISNISFDIDSKYVIEHKDLFLKLNETIDQNNTHDASIKHTIFEPKL